jgi:CheY-like chemotaxis protein
LPKRQYNLGYPLLGGLEHKVCCGSQHTRSSMPVVLMSGYPGGTAGEAALAIGADEVLQKPLSARDLRHEPGQGVTPLVLATLGFFGEVAILVDEKCPSHMFCGGTNMRIFLAGATGLIGIRLLPLMFAEGHVIAAMTRTHGKIDGLRAAGVTPVLCDIFDQNSLTAAVKDFQPDLIVQQVADLPDQIEKLPDFLPGNNRVRSEGTRNLLAAAQAANASGFLAQSIAWRSGPGTGPVVEAHENGVISAGGTVLRCGQFYGPGTFYENDPPPAPWIHIDDAARRTMPFLAGPRGIFTITDEDLEP